VDPSSRLPPTPPHARELQSKQRRQGGSGRRAALGVVLVIGVVLGLTVLGLVAVFWIGTSSNVHVPEGSWLEVELAGPLPEEQSSDEGLRAAFHARELSAQNLFHALRRATVDTRIRGILLRPDFFGGSWSQAEEIRLALADFRAAGKEVRAQLELPTPISYYLATAADRIALAPEGQLRIPGLQTRLIFLRDGLDRIGVRADFVAVGDYKSAPELFERREPSEPARRQAADYLDDVFELWIQGISDHRGLTPDRVLQLVDRAELESEEALEEGLVDEIATPTETLRNIGGGVEPFLVDASEYAIDARARALRGQVQLAVIYATGTIVPGRSGESSWGERYLGSDSLIDRLRQAREDDRIAAVVLRIDSPGGAVSASDLIYRAMEELRAEKPLVVSMGSLAASGGYYIAMSADRIVSTPTTLTGSIGVYLGKMEMSGLYEKLGIGHELLQRGEHASLYSELRPFNESQRSMLEERLQRFYSRFVSRVAEGRSMEVEAVTEVAGGRVWSGRRAVELGLADEVGGLGVAIQRAAELAGVGGSKTIGLRHFQPEPSFVQRLLAGIFELQSDLQLSGVEPSLGRIAGLGGGWASWWVTMDGRPQFHLPLRILVE